MTKTTSYEISKELEEIDFDVDTIFYYDSENEECQIWHELPIKLESEFVKSFDLETILDALPKHIEFKGPQRYAQESAYLALEFSKSSLPEVDYIYDDYDHTPVYNLIHIEGESLADTAARLLITLIKDKIVKL